jgi:hypothetical protein
MRTTTTWTNHNPNTIWNKLAARLGRQPTNAEAEAEVKRILANRPHIFDEPAYSAHPMLPAHRQA